MKTNVLTAALVVTGAFFVCGSLTAFEGEKQVQIETKIIEVSQNSNELGVRFDQLGNQEVELGAGADAGMDVARGLDQIPQLPAAGFGDQTGASMIRSIEASELNRIIASPRVVTTEAPQARISPAVELPDVAAPTRLDSGIKLDVIPQVSSGDTVQLKIEPVIVPDAPAIAGGVNPTAKPRGKVPDLRKVPVIGPLFQSREGKPKKAETVVIVTPSIVEPSE